MTYQSCIAHSTPQEKKYFYLGVPWLLLNKQKPLKTIFWFLLQKIGLRKSPPRHTQKMSVFQFENKSWVKVMSPPSGYVMGVISSLRYWNFAMELWYKNFLYYCTRDSWHTYTQCWVILFTRVILLWKKKFNPHGEFLKFPCSNRVSFSDQVSSCFWSNFHNFHSFILLLITFWNENPGIGSLYSSFMK